MRAGRLEEARTLAEQAVAHARVCTSAHGLLATILVQLGRPAQADAVIEQAIGLEPAGADACDAIAYVSLHLGCHERANVLYRRAAELSPDVARHWYNLAASERSFGRLDEAEAACNRAIGLDAHEYRSYLLRSELRVQTADANHVTELLRILERPGLEDRARVFVGYALGKELDDLQQFESAFRWFAEAAATRRRHLGYDVGLDELKLRRIAEVFPGSTPRVHDGAEDSERFIFIIGLPRSGTTLLERILSNLRGVRSNGETENFARALLGGDSPRTGTAPGDVFARAAAADPRVVAARYAQLARAERGEWIIEKLPINYLYLGAIQRALPRARLLLVSRTPLDSCFAMFRTLFGEAYPFSYDFNDLARYYAAYDRLVRHWRSTLGEGIHEVQYESLVSDPIGTGSAAARFCGLTWSDSAIAIESNSAVSLTASAAQVRRPIYGTSSGRWRHYRDQLAPLIAGLRGRQIELPAGA
ncbi:MAG: sulfotransferase family protein [Steroidobacteraceae bacterium]